MNFVNHLEQQRDFSYRTFGPGPQTERILDHIRKEMKEIEADPYDLEEWIDIIILACDGAWRTGAPSYMIAAALSEKLLMNMTRDWPDWRTAPQGQAIEHLHGPGCTHREPDHE